VYRARIAKHKEHSFRLIVFLNATRKYLFPDSDSPVKKLQAAIVPIVAFLVDFSTYVLLLWRRLLILLVVVAVLAVLLFAWFAAVFELSDGHPNPVVLSLCLRTVRAAVPTYE
jgi:hypothetical protein